MFPRRYFPGPMFAPTYFPPVSDVTTVPTGHPPRGHVRLISRPPDPDFVDDDEFFVMLI